jgi:arylsulfatase
MGTARELLRPRRAAAALLAGLAAACGPAEPPPLNLVLISLDTCRASALSSYGGPPGLTPSLTRLAAESVVFETCLAHSSGTAPSHMSLFTGQYVHRHGLRTNHRAVRPRATLAGVLAREGWDTAAFTGHGSLRAELGHAHGFETFESWVGEPRLPYTRNFDEVLPRALDWLDERAAAPFFLLVHGYDPHCPYEPPPAQRARLAGDYDGDLEVEGLCGMQDFGPLLESGEVGPEERAHLRDLYRAEIAAADAALGRFLDGLRERGLLERSIVVFTSDHGEVLGDHGWVGHTTMWEEELRVPLLIRLPAGHGARVPGVVQHVDVLPTLLAALGVPAPDGVQGVDLTPVLHGERGLPSGRLHVAQFGNLESVRVGPRWKAAFRRTPEGLRDARLFDLVTDPSELRDLSDDPDHAPRLRALVERYASFRKATRAEDRRYGGERLGSVGRADAELLDALGYAGGDD